MAIKTNKKNLKIVAATSGTIFSLVAAFVATIAWFSFNKTVGGNGMAINVRKLSGRLDCVKFYDIARDQDTQTPLIITNGTLKTYKFKKTPDMTIEYNWENNSAGFVDGSLTSFVMDAYSPLNQEHPLLVVFEFYTSYLSHEDGDIFVRGTTSITDFLGAIDYVQGEGDTTIPEPKYPLLPNAETNAAFIAPRKESSSTVDGAYLDTTDNKYYIDRYASSSIVNFKSRSFTADAYDSITGDEHDTIDINYDDDAAKRALATYDGVSPYDNFVTIDPTNPDSISLFNQSPILYSSKANEGGEYGIQYIATVVNYFPEAISLIYSTYLGNDRLENVYKGTLHFACDWSLEVF